VGQAVLGRKPDLGQTWQSTRRRLPWLLALVILSGLFSMVATTMLSECSRRKWLFITLDVRRAIP